MITFGEFLVEVAAPGQEDWILKNKAEFIKQYGKEEGLKILYATAWKRSREAQVSEQDIVELAYKSNIGMQEMMEFFKKATEDQKKKLQDLIDRKKTSEA
jgi:hypothetical protein